MKIVKLKNEKFGNALIRRCVSGYAFYQSGKGYVAFSKKRDGFGILIPYIPIGGRKALQNIIDTGGFIGFEGMEYVLPLS